MHFSLIYASSRQTNTMSTASSSEYEDDGYYTTSDEESIKLACNTTTNNSGSESSSGSENEPATLSCNLYEPKSVSSEESSAGSGSESDGDLDELYLSSPLPAPVATATTNKVVHYSTLKRDIPMGELVDGVTKQTQSSFTKSNELKTLASMNKSEFDEVQQKYDAKQQTVSLSKREMPMGKLVSTKDELTPLSSMTGGEFAEVKKMSDKRQNAMFQQQFAPKKLTATPTNTARSYSLNPVDALSSKKREELFIQTRTQLLNNLNSDKRTTSLACPVKVVEIDVEALSLQELREMVRECRAKHSAITNKTDMATTVQSLTHSMGPDTRVGKPHHTKLADPHGILAVGSVLGFTDDVVDTFTGRGDPYYYYDEDPYYYGPRYYGRDGYQRRDRRRYYYGSELSKKNGDILLKGTASTVLQQKNPLVHSSTLSASQLATVRENSAASTVSQQKSPLVHSNTLSASQLATVRENSAASSKLTNFNTLPLAQQKEIRDAMALAASEKSPVVKTFSNQKSSLNAKREYELKSSHTVMTNATVNSLYNGLACPMHVKEIALVDHLKRAYPDYDELLRKNVSRRVLDALFNSKDRNFIIIVPGKALLALYKQQGKSLEMAKMAAAYLTVLLLAEEMIPVDNTTYSCANLLRENRINVRRIDAETIEVDNTILAKLDRSSGGHLYKMIEPVVEDVTEDEEEVLIEDIVEEVLARVEERQQEEEAEVEEEELEEEEELMEPEEPVSRGNTTTIVINNGEERGGRRSPKMIATLPAANSRELAIVPVEEQLVMSSANTKGVFLAGVYRNTFYKNKKVEALASKMLNTQYSGAKDMANYIDAETQQVNELFIKTFSYDTLFEKCRATATQITTAERLTPENNFVIKANANTLSYTLDASLKMKEFAVDTKQVKISKRQLINHFNVLCFETKKAGQYASLCFSLPDETKSHTDTYMSADENMLLKFKDNLLQSVAINTSATNFTLSSMTSNGALSDNVLQNISVQVPMAEHATVLYAKELSFEQFTQALIPLSQSSFLKRVKAAYNEFTSAPVLRLNRISGIAYEAFNAAVASYAEGSERTVQVMMAIARGGMETVNKMSNYTFHRMLMRSNVNANQFLMRYDYDAALNQTKEHPSFNAMINTAMVRDAPTLSIELLHPLKKKKSLFRFQLASARSPPQDRESVYSVLSADGLHFDFVLGMGAKIERIYVRFFHHTAPSFEKDITKFLATEAHAYQRLKMNIGNMYMSKRIEKYLSNSTLPKEKLDLKQQREFFATLHKEIERYMEKENLTQLLVNAPSTKITNDSANILRESGYITLQPEELSHFHSLVVDGFSLGSSAVTTTNTNKVLDAVVREYKTLSPMNGDKKDIEFALYMDRFKLIASKMATDSSMLVNKK